MPRFLEPCLFSLQTLAILCLLGLASQGVAQQPGEPAVVDIGRDVIESQIKRLEENGQVQEEVRNQALERYRKALDALDNAAKFNATADDYAAIAAQAAERLGEIRTTNADPDAGLPPVDFEEVEQGTLADLERRLLQEQSALGLEDARLGELTNRLEQAVNGPAAARQRIAELQRAREELAESAQSAPPADEPEVVTRSRALVRQANLASLAAELRMLNQLVLTAPIRTELRTAERDVQQRRVENLRKRVRLLEELVNQKRLDEAEAASAQAAAAQLEAAGKHPLLDALAQRNAELGTRLRVTAQGLDRVTAQSAATAEEAKRLENDFQSTRQKIELAGLSQALGQALRERRRSLPDVRVLRREAAERETLIADASLQQIRDRDEREELRPVEQAAEAMLAGTAQADAALRPELEGLLRARLELLDKAIATQDAYVRALTDLEFNQQRLIETATRYDDFLAERLLWIRSTAPLAAEMLQDIPEQIGVLLSPANWFDVWVALIERTLENPLWLAPLILSFYLMSKRRKLLRALADTGASLGRPMTDNIVHTVKGLGLTLLAAAPWPILILSVALQLRWGTEASDFAKAVGQGLMWLPTQIFFLESFRTLCHSQGVAAQHFRWPAAGLTFLRRQIWQLLVVLAPATFVTVVLFHYFQLVSVMSILAFVATALALAYFFSRVLNPSGPVLHNYVQRSPNSLIVKLRMIWYPFSFLWPLAVAVYAALGYLYAAGMLTSRLIETMWFVLALVVGHALAVRWLVVTRRRLAYKVAMERREAARKAAEDAGEQSGGERAAVEDLRSDVEAPQIDLAALDVETRKLLSLGIVVALGVGLYGIWSSVLPAFGIFERIELWSHTVSVDGQSVVQPITLGDILLAFAIGLATVILAKSMPTFVEVVLLQRFKVTPGSRYAITTLLGYVIAAVGVIWGFNIIGADWSQLQWLVAALGVGIGFGLQEIVANFISGLIILFERPIRVGDWVTVGDTDGVVTRIQIRATTIRNWDRKELLVPNKEFITGRLLNWSLSDQVNRIVVHVGIAYGADVELALKLLEEAAREQQEVLNDPPPFATFDAFGDSALNLSLRLYLGTLDNRLMVTSAVNRAVMRKFHDAGIPIPFPQRDVHLDTTRPIDVRLHRGGGNA